VFSGIICFVPKNFSEEAAFAMNDSGIRFDFSRATPKTPALDLWWVLAACPPHRSFARGGGNAIDRAAAGRK
jgi:hypothetical protein